jgi:large conductance mechanosensitive channel
MAMAGCPGQGALEEISPMLKDFKAFIAKGNVMDLAVGVIIGAAFGAIVTSLTGDVIMPIVGWIFGGFDFSSHFIVLHMPADYHGSMADYAALKKAGAALIGYGAFITALINFLILAFIIFLLVRFTNKVTKRQEEAAGPTEVDLLTEIRDELRKK